MSSDSPLPSPKKPVKWTPAALRIMQMCEKAFACHNFLLLYFTNRKQFTPQFNTQAFKDLLRNKFQFLQLSRADKAGNWLATSFHVKCSPYYAILDPSNGQFLNILYGDVEIPQLRGWLQQFVSTNPGFSLGDTIFLELIEETQKIKQKASFSYGAKIRVSFTSSGGDERIVYVNRVAPLDIAFEKYCSEKGIEAEAHYFLFKGVELPRNMSASQFGLRNGSVVSVHPLEDKTSNEPLSVTVVNVDGSSAVFNVTRGKKVGVFLKSYCEMSSLNPQQVRFTFNNDVVLEDLTFAEHNMKNGDQLYAHMKPFNAPGDYMYRMLNSGDIPPMPMPTEYEVPITNPNLMFLYNQAQPRQPMAPGFRDPGFPGAPYVPPFTMPPPPQQPKTVHHYPSKPHDQNPAPSIWETFDMP